MQLNKQVCQKCLLQYGLDWNKGREINWSTHSLITCNFKDSQHMYRSFNIKEIPEHCKYKLEHTVLNNE